MVNRNIFIGVNSIKFYNQFTTDESCYQYLCSTKWGEDDYVCKKCGSINSYKYPLTGTVHVDEFFVGGEEEGKPGRSKGKKILVIVALEIVE